MSGAGTEVLLRSNSKITAGLTPSLRMMVSVPSRMLLTLTTSMEPLAGVSWFCKQLALQVPQASVLSSSQAS